MTPAPASSSTPSPSPPRPPRPQLRPRRHPIFGAPPPQILARTTAAQRPQRAPEQPPQILARTTAAQRPQRAPERAAAPGVSHPSWDDGRHEERTWGNVRQCRSGSMAAGGQTVRRGVGRPAQRARHDQVAASHPANPGPMDHRQPGDRDARRQCRHPRAASDDCPFAGWHRRRGEPPLCGCAVGSARVRGRAVRHHGRAVGPPGAYPVSGCTSRASSGHRTR